MPDLDLGPDDYRKQDDKSGRWLQNVDRRFCFWGGVVFSAVLLYALIGLSAQTGVSFFALFFLASMGFVIGGLFTLSLRRPDW